MSVLNLLLVDSLPKKMWKFHIFLCSEVLLTKSLILLQIEDSGLEFLWWIAGLSKNVLTLFSFPLWKSTQLLYILESNPHPFYGFRGLKNQMRLIIACRLDLRSRVGFWKNDRAAVHAVRTIQYNNLLFYLLLL